MTCQSNDPSDVWHVGSNSRPDATARGIACSVIMGLRYLDGRKIKASMVKYAQITAKALIRASSAPISGARQADFSLA